MPTLDVTMVLESKLQLIGIWVLINLSSSFYMINLR